MSGSVWALKTSSRGASNSRVTKSSCLPGSAVIIVLFFFSDISFLLFLKILQNFIEAVVAFAPVAFKRRNPVINRLEFFHIDPVQPLAAFPALAHQPNLLEHTQVLGNHRLGPPEQLHDLIHRPFPWPECIKDFASFGFGHGIEWVMR